ncbi:MAG: hypothetical protein FWD04_05490 [Conexibacteraceae bacterium]|nr:hypothetical protein [Conexibacteraceae bacterium]
MRRASIFLCLAATLGLAGCGSGSVPVAKQRRATGGIPPGLLSEARPIGRGPRFQPPLSGPVPGDCLTRLGRREQAHIELFGANRVVLLAAGIGTRAPREFSDGRLVRAACFGDLVTLDPTGTVYFRPGTRLTVGDLFTAWGQPLTTTRIASFSGGGRVRVYVDGHLRPGSPRAVPLSADAEIVLEVGPRVPPHSRFTFPRRPSPELR